jgi:hypothetical protein
MIVPTPAKKAAAPSKSFFDSIGKDNTSPEVEETEFDRDEDYTGGENDEDKEPVLKDQEKNEPYLSPSVVATVPNKTPAELSQESADETAARYNINTDVTQEQIDNPRIQIYKDTVVKQVPSGTHLHPDVAKDLANRGISLQGTDNAQVQRWAIDTHDFAPDAETNDKWQKPVVDERDDYKK